MNLYGFPFFALPNFVSRVFQQTFLNNFQPGGPSRRHLASFFTTIAAGTLFALSAGTAQAATLASTPSSVSFGTVPVGNKVTQTLAIKNSTASTAVVSSASISGSGFSISSLSTPFSLGSGATTF